MLFVDSHSNAIATGKEPHHVPRIHAPFAFFATKIPGHLRQAALGDGKSIKESNNRLTNGLRIYGSSASSTKTLTYHLPNIQYLRDVDTIENFLVF
jgi:hypothetical protein